MNSASGIREVLELIVAVKLLQENSDKEGRLIGGCLLSNKAKSVLGKHKPRKQFNRHKSHFLYRDCLTVFRRSAPIPSANC